MKKVILTGDRPTGRLHVGHYVVHYQRESDYRTLETMMRFIL